MNKIIVENLEVAASFYWLVENMPQPESITLLQNVEVSFGNVEIDFVSITIDYSNDGVYNPEFFLDFVDVSVDGQNVYGEIHCTGTMVSAGQEWIFS